MYEKITLTNNSDIGNISWELPEWLLKCLKNHKGSVNVLKAINNSIIHTLYTVILGIILADAVAGTSVAEEHLTSISKNLNRISKKSLKLLEKNPKLKIIKVKKKGR